jgi:hypothetical protein
MMVTCKKQRSGRLWLLHSTYGLLGVNSLDTVPIVIPGMRFVDSGRSESTFGAPK